MMAAEMRTRSKRQYVEDRDAREGCACQFPGCSQTTRQGKPYCPEHVLHHDYAASVRAQLDAREEEVRLASKPNPRVSADGALASELLWWLRQEGALTTARLARQLHIRQEVVELLAMKLAKTQQLIIGRTSRGGFTLECVSRNKR